MTAFISKTMKPKTCRCGCGKKFVPTRPMQPTSDDFDCKVRFAEQHAAKARAKRAAEQKRAERAEFRARKEKAKRTGDLKAEAQAAFNAYIRYRDLSAGHRCIDCGKPFEPDKPGGSVDAGHYLSRGSHPNLAFDERNVHAQRKNCNRPGGATAADFRLGVIARIGLAAVEALEADTTPRRYRADDYRQIRDTYRKKLKDLKSKHEQ